MKNYQVCKKELSLKHPYNWEQLGIMEQVENWYEDFMESLMEAQKKDAKDRKRGREFLF